VEVNSALLRAEGRGESKRAYKRSSIALRARARSWRNLENSVTDFCPSSLLARKLDPENGRSRKVRASSAKLTERTDFFISQTDLHHSISARIADRRSHCQIGRLSEGINAHRSSVIIIIIIFIIINHYFVYFRR